MAYQQPYYNGGYYPQYQNGAMPDMLNGYKQQYQMPQMQQTVSQPMPQAVQQPIPTQKSANELIWVQGEAGAKGYLVAPNNTVVLWDTESPTVYVKSADSNGIPSMRTLDFTERTNVPKTPETAPVSHECKCGSKFVSKEQFVELEDKYQEILCRLSDIEDKYKSLTAKPIPKSTKKGDIDNG